MFEVLAFFYSSANFTPRLNAKVRKNIRHSPWVQITKTKQELKETQRG